MLLKSCRGKLWFLVILIGVMVVANSLLIFRAILSVKQVNTVTYPVVSLANEMELATTQVQQYLSDISATRAQDGKDDGFDNAEENAKKYKEAFQQLTLLRPEKSVFLQEYEQAFDEYYQLGKKMAQAYVDFGPGEGNKLMPEFDDRAERLSEYTAQLRAESEKEMAANLGKVDAQVKIVLAIMLASGIVTMIMSLYMLRLICHALHTMIKAIEKDKNGYITLKEIVLDSEDEFGELASALNVLLSQVQEFVKQVSASAQQLAASAEELTAGTEQSAQAINQVAVSITEVSKGTERELHAVKEAAEIIDRISAGMQEVVAKANIVSGTSEKAAVAAGNGDSSIKQTVSQMGNIEKTVSSSADIIWKLGERSKEIGQIVDTISSIAGQTNLLALNAAIEAARAGEQGRGFAVVAEEVRKLAEQSQTATQLIAGLINEIQCDTGQAVAAMKDGTREVKLGAEVVNTAGQAFSEITSFVNAMSDQLKGITAAIQQMAGGSEQIVSSIRSVEIISENMAGQTQTVSAATEEQSACMEEIAGSSQSLAKMAQDLQTAIGGFRM